MLFYKHEGSEFKPSQNVRVMKYKSKRPRYSVKGTGARAEKAYSMVNQNEEVFLQFLTKKELGTFETSCKSYSKAVNSRKEKNARSQSATIRRRKAESNVYSKITGIRTAVNNSIFMTADIKKEFGRGLEHNTDAEGLISDVHLLSSAYKRNKTVSNKSGIIDSDITELESYKTELKESVKETDEARKAYDNAMQVHVDLRLYLGDMVFAISNQGEKYFESRDPQLAEDFRKLRLMKKKTAKAEAEDEDEDEEDGNPEDGVNSEVESPDKEENPEEEDNKESEDETQGENKAR